MNEEFGVKKKNLKTTTTKITTNTE